MIDLLEKIGEVDFSGVSEFVTSENFAIDVSGNNRIKISYLGNNFPAWFLDKIENNIPASSLNYSRLIKKSTDSEIVDALGGQGKAELFLAEMFYLMSLQPNGEEGILLNDGKVNFFYVKDVSGSLRTIRLLWQDGGWGVHAIRPHDVLNLPLWDEGSQIFSRGKSL